MDDGEIATGGKKSSVNDFRLGGPTRNTQVTFVLERSTNANEATNHIL